jgi:site-specific recombinase XerD
MQSEGNQKRSAAEKWRIFEREVEPKLGSKPLADVSRHELARLVADKHSHAPIMSNHLHSLLTRFFNWSMIEGWSHTNLEANPMIYVKKMAKPKARERTLSDDEIRLFFVALPDAGEFSPVFELILRTCVRRGEAFGMMGEEVSGDLWTIYRHEAGGSPSATPDAWAHASGCYRGLC